MKIRHLVQACVTGALFLAAGLAGAQEELRNDGLVEGQSAGFQSGFVAGEIGASRFVASGPGKLVKVQFLFGGGTEGLKKDLNLHVWNDTDLMDDPGIELYAGTYSVVSADMALQEVDLTDKDVSIPATFRVGVEMLYDGLPSIARDNDDTIAADRNFILVNGMTWKQSADLGLTGDWVIRAFVDTSAGGAGGGGGTGGTTASAGAGGGGAGGAAGGAGGATSSATGGEGSGDSNGGDCGCRTAGSGPGGGAGIAAILGTLAFGARRRRVRPSLGSSRPRS